LDRSKVNARTFAKAHSLLEQGDANSAVAEARIAHRMSPGDESDWRLAAILIDAGDIGHSLRFVREGKGILERLPAKLTELNAAAYHYNLGNAFATIGRYKRGTGAASHLATAEAVSHYDRACQLSKSADLRANLANALLRQGRYIEGIDELDALLDTYPDHYNAHGFRGSALLGISGWLNNAHKGLSQAALASYKHAVQFAVDDPFIAQHYSTFVQRLEQTVPPPARLKQKPMRADVQWIWANRLALNPCSVCRLDTPDAFDIYPISGVLSSPRRRPPTSELFSVLNAILATYGTARWQLWATEASDAALADDHVIQNAGASTPLVDLRLGLSMSAFAGFYRVLGQVASGINNCFSLKHPAKNVTFENVWGKVGARGLPKTIEHLHPGIRRRKNAPLSALYYLAASLEIGLGRYQDLRVLRNQIEHRLAVPVPDEKARKAARYYEGFISGELPENVHKLGRIAKAAIWYFAAALTMEEHRRVRDARRSGHNVVHGVRTAVIRR
jgi:tetratricopeptide (TPR) repeat protein